VSQTRNVNHKNEGRREMSKLKKVICCLLMLGFITILAGCEKGPAEKAGEKIDKTVEDAGKAVKEATK
jgi:hypothetical protein